MTVTANETDVASRVLELIAAAAGSSVEAEVLVERRESALTRFANSYIHQNVAESGTAVRLRVHADGRTTSTATTVLGNLDELVERTLAALRLAPADPTWPGLAPVAPVPPGGTADPATAEATPDDRASVVRAFVDAAAGLATAGYFSTSVTRLAFANSAGQAALGATTRAALDGIARTASSDGLTRRASARLADIDGGVLGARAAAKARAGADPVELAPGRYEVVLEPTAVADVLQMLSVYGFNGKAVQERRSFV
jgi:predicted Zn-dependent protease